LNSTHLSPHDTLEFFYHFRRAKPSFYAQQMLLILKLLSALGLGLLLCIVGFVFYCFISNRVDQSLARIFLLLLSSISGYFDVHFIHDSHPLGKKIIGEKRKGQSLEYLIASPVWFPLINVESVDGPVWKRLRQLVLQILKVTKFKTQIPEIIHRQVCEFSQDTRVTNEFLTRLNINVIWELLFKTRPSEQIVIDMAHLVEHMRGSIAMKIKKMDDEGALKYQCMRYILNATKNIPELQAIADEAEYEIEFCCAVLQPFFVSPGINIADIFIPLLQNASKSPCLCRCLEDVGMAKNLIAETIFIKHPFPILERDLSKNIGPFKKNSHVFVMNLDGRAEGTEYCPKRWEDSKFYRGNFWKLFGSGPRNCVGAQLALVWLPELIHALHAQFGLKNLVPWEGHRHSGRHNDEEDNPFEAVKRIGLAVVYRMQKSFGLRKLWFHESHTAAKSNPLATFH